MTFLRGEVFFQNAPPFHIGGLILMTLYLGLTKKVVLFTPKSIHSLLKKVKEYNVSCFFLVQFINSKVLTDKEKTITVTKVYGSNRSDTYCNYLIQSLTYLHKYNKSVLNWGSC